MSKLALSGILVLGAFVMAGCAAEAEQEPASDEPVVVSEGALVACQPFKSFNITVRSRPGCRRPTDAELNTLCRSNGYTSAASETFTSSTIYADNICDATWRVSCERDCTGGL